MAVRVGEPKSETVGGYDYDFEDKIHDRFICSICTKVMRDPHLLVCCGQKYCYSCLQRWLKTQRTPICPHCRAKESGPRPFQNIVERGMKSEIESFRILCSNHNKGCEWIGELRDLDGHLKSDEGCAYFEVACPNKCSAGTKDCTKIQRMNLQVHLKYHCELRKVTCQYCNQIIIAKNYPRHQLTCIMFPMECPNQCGEQGLVRRSVKTHREVCKLEVIACSYAQSGCEEKVTRQDMNKHLLEYQGHHLEKVNVVNRKLAEDLKRLNMETQEKRMIVQKELKIAERMHGSANWLKSIKTQINDTQTIKTQINNTRILTNEEFYFRMLHFPQIKSGLKDWFSPQFEFNGHVMRLHVMQSYSHNLNLELRLVKAPESGKYQQATVTKIAIQLIEANNTPGLRRHYTYPFKKTPQFHHPVHQQRITGYETGTVYYNFTAPSLLGSEITSSRLGSEIPSARLGSEIPSARLGSEIPSARLGSEIPSARLGSEIPSARLGSEIPSARLGSEIPSARLGSEIPSARLGSEIPSARLGSEIPSARLGSEIPSARLGSEIPSARLGSEIPSARLGSEIPSARLVSEIPSARLGSEIPSARLGSEIPSARLGSEIPSARLGSEIPSARLVSKIPSARLVSEITSSRLGSEIRPLTSSRLGSETTSSRLVSEITSLQLVSEITPSILGSEITLQSWQTNSRQEWESRYVDDDSLLWAISTVRT